MQRSWRSTLVIAVAIACAGCGGASVPKSPAPVKRPVSHRPAAASTPAASTPSGSLRTVTLRFDASVPYGPDTPFILAKAKGYYRAAGLNVRLGLGHGSATTASTVANGSDAFGIADAGTVALIASKGAPIEVIADFVQQSPMAFIHNPQVVLKSIPDLKNLTRHTLLSSAGAAINEILPAVLAEGHMTPSQVKIDMISRRVIPQTFLKDPSTVMMGFDNGNHYFKLQQLDPKVIATPFSQFGINLLSTGLITSTRMLRDHPQEVRAFVKASVQGWKAAQADPQAAADATAKAFSGVNPKVIVSELHGYLKTLHTAASAGHPIGWMAQQDWRQTLSILHRYGGLKAPKSLGSYYTDAYLP